MLFNKANQVIELLNNHGNAVIGCFAEYTTIFEEIVNSQTNNPEKPLDKSFVVRLKTLESDTDKIRHKVIFQLLQGGFLVDSRKTMMRLVEGVDQIADMTENIVRMIVYEKILIAPFLVESLKKMNSLTETQLLLFMDVLRRIVTKYNLDEMIRDIRLIEAYESQVDIIENQLIVQLFEQDSPLADKLQLKALINSISFMSDEIEDLSDEVEIILASRRI